MGFFKRSIQEARCGNVDYLTALLEKNFHKVMDLADETQNALQDVCRLSKQRTQTAQLIINLVR